MLEVKAFRGFRYNTARIGNPDHVITPPYDVITPDEREKLAAKSPYNLTHLILPKQRGSLTPYLSAAEYFRAWTKQGVLQQDAEPSYYLVRQRFTDLDGAERVRRGFFGVIRIPEANERYILGHERTFDNPVEDRLNLMRATEADLEPIFGLYTDPDGRLQGFLAQMDARKADISAKTFDGVQQELWRVPSDPVVAAHLRGKTIYIADGHHRFRTACTYRDEMRAKVGRRGDHLHDFVMMGFVALEDPGLRVHPTHRMVPKPDGFDAAAFLTALGEWFEVQRTDALLPALNAAPGACVIGLSIHGDGDYLLTLKDIDRTALLGDDRGPAWRDLDVAVLHRGILERILKTPEGALFGYDHHPEPVLKAAQDGETGMAFLLRATRADQIRACAEANEPMPQKSTYFFPKLPSGGVIYRLAE